MCHYNILKCIRCRKVYPQGYELCENLDQGSICIDKEKLAAKSDKLSMSKDDISSITSTSNIDSKSSPVDLVRLLRHKYEYTDGCLNCGG